MYACLYYHYRVIACAGPHVFAMYTGKFLVVFVIDITVLTMYKVHCGNELCICISVVVFVIDIICTHCMHVLVHCGNELCIR